MKYRLKSPLGTVSGEDEPAATPAPETKLQHHGDPGLIEEFSTVSTPTAPPNKELLTQAYEAMRAAGWTPKESS